MAPGCSTMMCTACTGGPRPDPPTSEYVFVTVTKDFTLKILKKIKVKDKDKIKEKAGPGKLRCIFTINIAYNLSCETPGLFQVHIWESNEVLFRGQVCLGL